MVLSALIILVQKLFPKQQNTRALKKKAWKWLHVAQSLKKKNHKMSHKTLAVSQKLNTNLTYDDPAIPVVAI